MWRLRPSGVGTAPPEGVGDGEAGRVWNNGADNVGDWGYDGLGDGGYCVVRDGDLMVLGNGEGVLPVQRTKGMIVWVNSSMTLQESEPVQTRKTEDMRVMRVLCVL